MAVVKSPRLLPTCIPSRLPPVLRSSQICLSGQAGKKDTKARYQTVA